MTLTLDTTNGNLNYVGTIRDGAYAGPLSINKLGAGTLTLGGVTNAWSGTMNVQAARWWATASA